MFSTASRLRGTQNWNWDSVVIAATRLRGNIELELGQCSVRRLGYGEHRIGTGTVLSLWRLGYGRTSNWNWDSVQYGV